MVKNAESRNRQSTTDFKSLCAQAGYSALHNMDYLAVKTSKYPSTDLGDFIVAGYFPGDESIKIPGGFNTERSGVFLAVVYYGKNDVKQIYIFKAADIKKTELSSVFKYDKDGISIIILPDDKTLEEYNYIDVLEKLTQEEKPDSDFRPEQSAREEITEETVPVTDTKATESCGVLQIKSEQNDAEIMSNNDYEAIVAEILKDTENNSG